MQSDQRTANVPSVSFVHLTKDVGAARFLRGDLLRGIFPETRQSGALTPVLVVLAGGERSTQHQQHDRYQQSFWLTAIAAFSAVLFACLNA